MQSTASAPERFPFWAQLTEPQQALLRADCRTERFAKGSLVNRSDEGCRGAILIQSGQLRVYIVSEQGREVTLYRLNAGDVCVLSASCLLDSIVFDVMIAAAADTDALLLPAPTLHKVMQQNPLVELYLAKTANERFSDVMWTMQQLLFLGVDQRTAAFLWDEIAKTDSLTVCRTHDEIAREIGTAREVVTRVLKYFAAEGALRLGRGKIEITDKAKLKKYL